MEVKIFHAFRQGKRQMLAMLNSDHNFSIVNEKGNNYGAWQTIENFRKAAKKGKVQSLGKCQLRLACVQGWDGVDYEREWKK